MSHYLTCRDPSAQKKWEIKEQALLYVVEVCGVPNCGGIGRSEETCSGSRICNEHWEKMPKPIKRAIWRYHHLKGAVDVAWREKWASTIELGLQFLAQREAYPDIEVPMPDVPIVVLPTFGRHGSSQMNLMRCVCCGRNGVDEENGDDFCQECKRRD
jgi:hypothetical protein